MSASNVVPASMLASRFRADRLLERLLRAAPPLVDHPAQPGDLVLRACDAAGHRPASRLASSRWVWALTNPGTIATLPRSRSPAPLAAPGPPSRSAPAGCVTTPSSMGGPSTGKTYRAWRVSVSRLIARVLWLTPCERGGTRSSASDSWRNVEIRRTGPVDRSRSRRARVVRRRSGRSTFQR